ncbi:MAG: hypothetical protein U0804_10825 [Gemmataceae bacterium]
MRWTKRERTTGEVVAVVVLVAGALSASPAGDAAKVQPGMTAAEVAAALGSEGRPDYATEQLKHGARDLSDLWSESAVDRGRAMRKADSSVYRDYDVAAGVVAVAFHGPEGEERVTSAEGYRVFRPGWHLVPWLVGAVAAGFLTAEALRWRRARPAVPVAVPVGAAS